jgi:predicted lysophospholipase L1 biosynthesis ABC-type transport system permease subunit
MKPIQEYEQDIASIRSMMERSAKFISLSGLSGVLAGVYALAGAAAAFIFVRYPLYGWESSAGIGLQRGVMLDLLGIAAVVLVASISTGLWLSSRKARKHGTRLWTPASKTLCVNLAIPLVSGGVFILIMIYSGYFALAAPACLLFYGLALIQASANTFQEVRYLGFCEIALGLVSACMPGYGLIFWAVGFGVLHIIYGAIMHNKYDT